MKGPAMIDFQTKMVAREIHAAAQEHDPKIAWTELSVHELVDGEPHFFVTDGQGRKYRVTIQPE